MFSACEFSAFVEAKVPETGKSKAQWCKLLIFTLHMKTSSSLALSCLAVLGVCGSG